MFKTRRGTLCLAILLLTPTMALTQRYSQGSQRHKTSGPPTLSSISPASATAGGPAFTLTVSGSSFSTNSKILWNGSSLSTTYVSDSQLTAAIPVTLIAAAGTAQIAVYNPGRSGGTSNMVSFTIGAATPSTSTTTTTTTSPVAITTLSLPSGTAGTAYSTTLAATGGTSPYSWEAGSGVPPGLSLASNGTLSGTPTTSGSYSFSVQVKDSAAATATLTYSVAIGTSRTATTTTTTTTSRNALAISTVSLPNGTAGTAYSATLAATGGTTPYTWSISSGSPPASVTLSASGALSGTPTTSGSSSFTAQVMDSAGGATTKTYTMTVAPVLTTAAATCSGPYGNCGDPYEGSGGPPSTYTAIPSCGSITPTSKAYYLVTANLGSDPTQQCLVISNSSATGWTLDLGGHSVIGNVTINSNLNGDKIFNGSITCNIPDSKNCMTLWSAVATGAPSRVAYLNITQQYTGPSQARCIFMQDSGGTSSGFYKMRFDHLTLYPSETSAGITTRRYGISVNAAPNVMPGGYQFDHNYGVCDGNSYSCWIIGLYRIQGVQINYNLANLAPLSPGYGKARLLNWEDTLTGITAQSEVAYNDVTVNNNQALRIWCSSPADSRLQTWLIHDNVFRSIYTGDYTGGGIELGSAGSYVCDEGQPQIYNNTFDMVGGNAINVGAAKTVHIFKNTVTCSTGACPKGYYFARTNLATSISDPSTNMIVSNNNVGALTLAHQPAVMVCQSPTPSDGNVSYLCAYSASVSLSTSATVCNSGDAVGNGPINNTAAPCPQ
jgi:hypothetical protein